MPPPSTPQIQISEPPQHTTGPGTGRRKVPAGGLRAVAAKHSLSTPPQGEQRWHVVLQYRELKARPSGRAHSAEYCEAVSALRAEHGVTRGWLSRQSRGCDARQTLSRLPREDEGAGSRSMLAAIDALQKFAVGHKFDFTYDEAVAHLEGLGEPLSYATIWGVINDKECGWKQLMVRVKPALDEKHWADRRAWAGEHACNDFKLWLGLDEKQWYTARRGRKRGGAPPGTPAPVYISRKSKTQVPGTQACCVVGRPVPGKFDGKLGIYRLGHTHTAKKASKNHAVGDRYHVDKGLDALTPRGLMVKRVFADIKRKFKFARGGAVTAQIDGAKGHTGKGNVDALNKAGAKCNPKITIVVQPAQSPDTNTLGLALLGSLACRNHRLQKLCRVGDKGALWKNLLQAWREYPPALIEKAFVDKALCIDEIKRLGGGNYYECPHATQAERAARLPPLTWP